MMPHTYKKKIPFLLSFFIGFSQLDACQLLRRSRKAFHHSFRPISLTKSSKVPFSVTASQVTSFKGNGYVVVPKLLPSPEVNDLRNDSDKLSQIGSMAFFQPMTDVKENKYDQCYPNYFLTVLDEEQDSIYKIEHIRDVSNALRKLLEKHIQPAVNILTGDRYKLFKDKITFNAPKCGAYRPRQESAHYAPFGWHNTLTVMIPLDSKGGPFIEIAANYKEIDSFYKISSTFGNLPIFPIYENGPRVYTIKESICRQFKWENMSAKKGDMVCFTGYVPYSLSALYAISQQRTLCLILHPEKENDFYHSYYAMKFDHLSDTAILHEKKT